MPLRFQTSTLLAAAPDGTCFAIAKVTDVYLMDASKRYITRLLRSYGAGSWKAVFSPNSTVLAVGSIITSAIHIFDAQMGTLQRKLRWGRHAKENLIGKATSITFSPDSTYLAYGTKGGAIRFGCVSTGQLVKHLSILWWDVTCLTFSPDGFHLACGDSGGCV